MTKRQAEIRPGQVLRLRRKSGGLEVRLDGRGIIAFFKKRVRGGQIPLDLDFLVG